MMFAFSYSAFNEGVLSNAVPAKTTYKKLTVYGDCVVDQLHGQSREIDDADLIDKYDAVSAETWDDDYTLFLANFEDTLEAGNVLTGLEQPITSYQIRRQNRYAYYDFLTSEDDYFHTTEGFDFLLEVDGGSSLNPLLVEISDPTVSTFKDYTAKNYLEYIYTVYPVYQDLIGQGIEDSQGGIALSFWGYTLTDTVSSTPTITYIFDTELESDSIKLNRGFKVFENHTQYPSVRYNNRKYRSGRLSTMPLDQNLAPSNSDLQTLIAFLEDGTEKNLRTPSGDIMRVVTSNVSYKYLDRIADQPYNIEFDFIEVDSI